MRPRSLCGLYRGSNRLQKLTISPVGCLILMMKGIQIQYVIHTYSITHKPALTTKASPPAHLRSRKDMQRSVTCLHAKLFHCSSDHTDTTRAALHLLLVLLTQCMQLQALSKQSVRINGADLPPLQDSSTPPGFVQEGAEKRK